MPGVPKSLGCENCRHRKKGCGLQRPRCGRCMKLGLQCGRFGKGVKFIDETPNLTQGKRSLTGGSRSEDPFQEGNARDAPGNPNSPLVRNLSSMNRSSFEAQALGSFWDAFIPRQSGDLSTVAANFNLLSSLKWLQTALSQAHKDIALSRSLVALALSHTSRLAENPALRLSAMLFYDASIREVIAGLKKNARSFDDSLLAAIMVLGIYEIHEGGTQERGNAWMAHVNGASRLIGIRGARNFTSEFGCSLYFGHLMNDLIRSTGSRNGPRASVDLSAYIPPPSTFERRGMQFVHMLGDIPYLMQEAEAIKNRTEIKEIIYTLRNFRSQSKKVINDLQKWHRELQGSQRKDLHWPKVSHLYSLLPEDSPERIFPICLCFLDIGIAYQEILLWTFLLLIHRTLDLASGWVQQNHPTIDLDTIIPPIPQHRQDTCHLLAANIAMSLEYFAQPETGLVGVQQIGFPMSVAMSYFSYSNAPEMLWFRVIFRRLKEIKAEMEGFTAVLYTGAQHKLFAPGFEAEHGNRPYTNVSRTLVDQFRPDSLSQFLI